MEISVGSIEENVRIVESSRNYWFIRTYKGQLFDIFFDQNYVGLGLNSVPLKYIENAQFSDDTNFKILKNYIEKNENYKKGASTKIAKQLIDFEFAIKNGDVIIIPSKDSDNFAIGLVEGSAYLVENPGTFSNIVQGKENAKEPLPQKRRKIKWLRTLPSDFFRGDLSKLISSQQPLTNANNFGDKIETGISDLYIRGTRAYLNILIDQDEDINAFALNDFLSSLTYFYKKICLENDMPENEDLFIKIKLQSKGNSFLIGTCVLGIIGLGTLFAVCNNPKIDITIGKYHLKAEGIGLIQSIDKHKEAMGNEEMKNKEDKLKFNKDSLETEIQLLKLRDSVRRLKADTSRLENQLIQNEPNKNG